MPRASRATSGERGVELSWLELGANGANGAQTAKFANVTCAPAHL